MANKLNYGELRISKCLKILYHHVCTGSHYIIKNTKDKFVRHLAGRSGGTSPFLVIEGEEPKQKMIAFNKSNLMGAKIDKFTSMVEKLSTQHRQSKPFKPRVYQGRGKPFANSRMVTNIITTVEIL